MMINYSKEIKNPVVFWAFRALFWLGILFILPFTLVDCYKTGFDLIAISPIFLNIYLVAVSFILGYRFDNPPKWAQWLLPASLISDIQARVYSAPKTIKKNRVLQAIAGVVLLVILLFAFLSGWL